VRVSAQVRLKSLLFFLYSFSFLFLFIFRFQILNSNFVVNFVLRLNVQFAHISMEIIYLCIYFILCSISSFSHFHFEILNFNLGFNPNSQLIIFIFIGIIFTII
jgi:hypothetical protein